MSQLLIATGRSWLHPAPRHPAHDQTHNYCPERPLQPGIASGSHRHQERNMHAGGRSNFSTTGPLTSGYASVGRVETLNRYILKSWQFGVRCSALGVRRFLTPTSDFSTIHRSLSLPAPVLWTL